MLMILVGCLRPLDALHVIVYLIDSQVLGPLKAGELFVEEDFTLLEKFMMSSSTGKIEKKIKTLKLEADRLLIESLQYVIIVEKLVFFGCYCDTILNDILILLGRSNTVDNNNVYSVRRTWLTEVVVTSFNNH